MGRSGYEATFLVNFLEVCLMSSSAFVYISYTTKFHLLAAKACHRRYDADRESGR